MPEWIRKKYLISLFIKKHFLRNPYRSLALALNVLKILETQLASSIDMLTAFHLEPKPLPLSLIGPNFLTTLGEAFNGLTVRPICRKKLNFNF